MVAEKHASQLKRIKRNVEKANSYFKKNNERFHAFRTFVFKTQLSADDISLLQTLNKPQLEFNILNAYISRLCGEFSKQEPNIAVMTDFNQPVDELMIKVIEGHVRHIFCDAADDATQYNCYKDTLSGGFSVMKVFTEYANERSFDRVIKMRRVFEPTLCGFDPLAQDPHKGDGQYCYELFPRTKDEFKREFPNVDLDKLDFTREIDDFNWAFNNDKEDILIVCEYYEKKKKKRKLVRLANGATMFAEEYEAELVKWNEQGNIEQPPAIVETRNTDAETIVRYRLIGNEILDYKETSYRYLPLVFIDGDSCVIKAEGDGGSFTQFTKPYVYHAKGTQRLKNFAGQTLANELENMVMHKFMIPEQGLPTQEDYQDALTNIQQANVVVYNAFKDDDPNVPVPPPREIQRTPTPPEVTNAFSLTDGNVQTILGSYDAALGINDNELSGIAIVEGATQSNAAAMPYVVSYMHSLTQIAKIILDLIPKNYKTPRTIPVQGLDGKKGYIMINQPGGVDIKYDASSLNVRVEAGVNFAVQKNKALMQMTAMMQASPLFAQFMNTDGLPILLDNMEFRGVDILKQRAEVWMEEMKKQQEQASQQPNPDMLKQMNEAKKTELKEKEMEIGAVFKDRQYELDAEKIANERMNVMVKAGESREKVRTAQIKADAENKRSDAELHMNMRKHLHQEVIDHKKIHVEHRKIDNKPKVKPK